MAMFLSLSVTITAHTAPLQETVTTGEWAWVAVGGRPSASPCPAHLSPCPARDFATGAFQGELPLPYAPKLGVPPRSFLLEPSPNSPTF